MTLKDIMCGVCHKQRAQKLCKRCPAPGKFCSMCWANSHAQLDHGKPKTLCVDCFSEPAAVECDTCTGKICKKCIAAHMVACQCSSSEDDSPMSEDEDCDRSRSASPTNSPRSSLSESSEDVPLAPPNKPRNTNKAATNTKRATPGGSTSNLPKDTAPPAAKKSRGASKPAKKKTPKEPKKVAEVIEDKAKAPANRPDVEEGIMNRIKKALALGLHCGGNEAEKKHAMQRATRLLQQHGLSQADVENMSGSGVEEASGMVKVRLNGLHVQWPDWGRTVGSVAVTMTNTKWFMNKGAVGGACYTVTFYGLKADAAMAAAIFEVAYNSVLHLSSEEMKGKGARAQLDYRQGMANGLYSIAKADQKEREKALEAARVEAAAAAAAAVAPPRLPAASGKAAAKIKPEVKPDPDCLKPTPLGERSSNSPTVKPEVKPDPDAPMDDPLDDDGNPWKKVKLEPEGGGGTGKRREHWEWSDAEESSDDDGGDDYDDVGSDEDWVAPGAPARKENTQKQALPAKAPAGAGAAAGAGKASKGSSKGGEGEKMQQMVLYDDKAKLACEAVEAKLKIKKGRKRKAQIKDHAAYRQGKASASKVNLGVKALPASRAC